MQNYERCIDLRDDEMTFNSTLSVHGTVVAVSCPDKYELVGPEVVSCRNGLWSPHIPHCLKSENSMTTTTIIVVTCLASVVCIVVLVLALFMLCRRNLNNASKQQLSSDTSDTKSMDLDEKMKSMNLSQYYASQDSVGMPVISYDNMDRKLRGNSQRSADKARSIDSSELKTPVADESDKDFIY